MERGAAAGGVHGGVGNYFAAGSSGRRRRRDQLYLRRDAGAEAAAQRRMEDFSLDMEFAGGGKECASRGEGAEAHGEAKQERQRGEPEGVVVSCWLLVGRLETRRLHRCPVCG